MGSGASVEWARRRRPRLPKCRPILPESLDAAMTRFASFAALLLASAALPSARTPLCPRPSPPPRPQRRHGRRRRRRHRPRRRARRRASTLRQWRLARRGPRSRPTASSIGSFLTAALLVEQRNVDIIAGAARSNPARRHATSAGSPIIMPPISTAPRSTRAAPRRSSRMLAAHPGDRQPPRPLRRARRLACAPTSIR